MNNTVSTANANSFRMPDFRNRVSTEMIKSIKNIGYFSQSGYSGLDIAETLDFYTKRYVQQLFDFKSVDHRTTIVDIGTGFGWLCIAFAYCTNARIIAIEPNEARLDAGRQIARILGIEHKIEWRVGTIDQLPLSDKEADVVYCIEVLEHVYRSKTAIHELCRVAADLIVLTTPNLWFPVIGHDTHLPFCHWLPVPMRRVYAKVFNRQNRENDNLFWSPISLQKSMREFEPVSNWLHYYSYKRFLATYPFYLPYRPRFRYVKRMSVAKKLYYDLISKFGIISHWFLPSLACVFRRK